MDWWRTSSHGLACRTYDERRPLRLRAPSSLRSGLRLAPRTAARAVTHAKQPPAVRRNARSSGGRWRQGRRAGARSRAGGSVVGVSAEVHPWRTGTEPTAWRGKGSTDSSHGRQVATAGIKDKKLKGQLNASERLARDAALSAAKVSLRRRECQRRLPPHALTRRTRRRRSNGCCPLRPAFSRLKAWSARTASARRHWQAARTPRRRAKLSTCLCPSSARTAWTTRLTAGTCCLAGAKATWRSWTGQSRGSPRRSRCAATTRCSGRGYEAYWARGGFPRVQVREKVRAVKFLHNTNFFAAAQDKCVARGSRLLQAGIDVAHPRAPSAGTCTYTTSVAWRCTASVSTST